MDRYGEATAHPSLALVKYWGKANSTANLPGTPSLGITLDGLTTKTQVKVCSSSHGGISHDAVYIDGVLQEKKRFDSFFKEFRRVVAAYQIEENGFSITAQSSSNFPVAAGLASSSSGFAALACACAEAVGMHLTASELSSLARIGSASAARSLFGGFTRFDAGAEYACQIYDEHWWPELRIVVLELEKEPKTLSSRKAMEQTRTSSPYYGAWLKDSRNLMEQALKALEKKNLDALGPLIRNSYLRMFATMLSANPPIIYWKPISLMVLHLCDEMRADGISVWETMDAGPQVKIFCTEEDTGILCKRLNDTLPGISFTVCRAGGPPYSARNSGKRLKVDGKHGTSN